MSSEDRFVAVDYRALSKEALRALMEEFVTREGTDYGFHEEEFDDKVRDVERQLESGEAWIVYDMEEERANIVPADDLSRRRC